MLFDFVLRDILALHEEFADVFNQYFNLITFFQTGVRPPVFSFLPAQLSPYALTHDKIMHRKLLSQAHRPVCQVLNL